MNERQLKRAKKASAGLSIAGGSLGLAGLGALVAKKPETAAKLSVGATGVGGIGSYNYAAIQRAEAKKRGPNQQVFVVRNKRQIKDIKTGLQPVTKGLDMLDFGLGSVVQPGEVSKALSRKQNENVQNAAAAGAVAAPLGYHVGRAGGQGAKAGFQMGRFAGASKPAAVGAGARTIPSAVRGAVRGSSLTNGYLKASPFKLAAATVGGAAAAGAGAKGFYNRQNSMKPQKPKMPKQPVAKADWMNISEHERRARDSRRTRNRGKEVAGWGGAAVTGAVAHRSIYAPNRPDVGTQAGRFTSGLKYTAKQAKISHDMKLPGATKRAGQSIKGLAKVNPHGATAVGGAALLAGGVATMAGARVNEKRHDRAIARQRRVRKDLVFKAYNPEDRRKRRLNNTATAMAVGGGGALAGGGALGRKSVGTKPYDRQVKAGGKLGAGVIHNAGTGLRSETAGHFGFKRGVTPSGFKGGLRTAGTGAALGLTGVALAVGSDRVRQYGNKGKGRTYRPLHRNI